MTKKPKTTRSLAKANEEQKVETIKLGMDVHAGQITVCRQVEGLLPQPAQKMSWEKALLWIQTLVKSGAKVYSCYEAGPCGFGLHRQLTALGVINVVVAPQRWDEAGKRVKTDKSDARELVDRLDRYVRGNTKAFSVVRVPSPEEEIRRCVCRQRGMVIKERNRCVVRGHGMMLAQGIQAPAQWWMPACWLKFRGTLPEWLRDLVGFWQRMALSFHGELEAMDEKVCEQVQGSQIPKGFGTLTFALVGSEIVDWYRFKNRGQVSSYTGLCPSENSSGESRKQGSVTKHGNARIRHQLVEAVWRLEQWQPDYPPVKKLREAKGKRSRKKLAVAAARRLAVDLWRIETGQCSAQKLGLKLVTAKA